MRLRELALKYFQGDASRCVGRAGGSSPRGVQAPSAGPGEAPGDTTGPPGGSHPLRESF